MKPFGHCLCGALRYAFDATKARASDICHCESCRRATGAPMVATFAVSDTAWRWTEGTPAQYVSSPGVTRGFCGTCGTSMTYTGPDWPGETHFLTATLDDPADLPPEAQVFCDEALPWAAGIASLPRKD